MEFRAVFAIGFFLLISQAILTSASKANKTHHHKEHHDHSVKKSKTTTANKTISSLPKQMRQAGSNFGLLAIPAMALTEMLGVGGKANPKDVKTKRNRTTKINGPFKTVTTVTQQFKMDGKNKSKMIGQSVESVTTPVNSTKDNGKGKKSGLFFDYNPFGAFLFNDEAEGQCSAKKPCKKKGTYCSEDDEQCKPTKKPGSKCDQPDQCSAKGGKYACIWGICSLVSANAGYSGQFCKKDADCGTKDMQCIEQRDVSEFSDICVPKASEGQTCGRTSLLDYWPFRRSISRRTSSCKKGLACVHVGYSGRMICRTTMLAADKPDDE